jgi:hypothetical protein
MNDRAMLNQPGMPKSKFRPKSQLATRCVAVFTANLFESVCARHAPSNSVFEAYRMVQGGRRINPGPRRSNGKAFIKRILSELWPANSRFNLKGHSAAEPQPNFSTPPQEMEERRETWQHLLRVGKTGRGVADCC